MRVKSPVHFDYDRHLKEYIENLPENVRLSFLADPALNQTFGDTIILLNFLDDYALLKASAPSKKSKQIIDFPESKEQVAIRCVERETKLKVTSDPILIGTPQRVDNSHPELYGRDYFKNTMLITGFEGIITINDPFIWVKTKLLTRIFVPKGDIPHHQAYAYNDLVDYLQFRRMYRLQ